MAKGQIVTKHPDRAIIDQLFISGWLPAKVHSWLVRMKKTVVSEQTLLHYRNNYLKNKMMLSPSTYAKKLKQIDVHIDSLQELYNLIEIQKRRLGPLLEEEFRDKTVLPSTRKEMELLKDTIIKIIELEMDLGIRAKSPIEIIERRIDVNDLVTQFMMAKEGWVIPDP